MVDPDLLGIVGPALAVGLTVGAVHVPFGIEVLRRGIVFIDLATAQVVALGIVLAGTLLPPSAWPAEQVAVFASAFAAAAFFRAVERRLPREQEAVIGSTFVVAASAALLAVHGDPHGGEELRNVLSGQILFVTWDSFAACLPVYGAVALAWIAIPRARTAGAFFLLFAVTVTASVQLVGVYVVFASLILPALAVNRNGAVGGRLFWRYAAACLCSSAAVVAGILGSAAFDLPAGPTVVLCYAGMAIVVRCIPAATGR